MYVGVCTKAVSYVFTNPISIGIASNVLSWLLSIVITALIVAVTTYAAKKAVGLAKQAKNIWLDWRKSEETKASIKEAMEFYLGTLESPALEDVDNNGVFQPSLKVDINLSDEDVY